MLMTIAVASAVLAVTPPPQVGAWTRPQAPKVVEPAEIFAYMDGAGELYLAYSLVRIQVYEYTALTEGPILLELYQVAASDDAYGLLSGDWGGEPLALDAAWPAAPPRALYGEGLLRIWSDDLFVRVMATSETEASRAAVIAIGRAVVAGRRSPDPPALVAALPPSVGADYRLRPDRTTFLRSHLVLNSIYFLGTTNLLRLSPKTEAVAASYARGEGPQAARVRLVVVRYPDESAAREALAQFQQGYLKRAEVEDGRTLAQVEDGWLGVRRDGARLVLVFEGPDAATVKAVLDSF